MIEHDLLKLIAERDKITQEIELLVRQKEGIEQGDVQSVAEVLHRYMCRSSHDGSSCPWWITEWTSNPRKEFLQKARLVIELANKYNIKPSVLVDIIGVLTKL